MAQLPISVGTTANDGTGTNWRTAWSRVQDNFTDLYSTQSKTINAGDVRFAGGATTEARIQLAINRAIADLAERVFVPAFMLPYDASLIAFTHPVMMVREGGGFSVLDVRAYGATGDGIADDTPSINAAIIRAQNFITGQTVYFPPGTYRSGPLSVAGQNVVLQGPGGGTWAAGGPVVIKYNGAAGGTMLRFEPTAAGSGVEHLSFDGNSVASTCVHFVSGDGQSLGACFINRAAFQGYQARGLILGADDTGTLRTGQLSPFSASHLRFDGGGANAIGILSNAQNMEWGTFQNLYFDPNPPAGYANHDYHIYQFAGAMAITGLLTTRADLAVIFVRDHLVINGWRAEEDVLITSGAANFVAPVMIHGLQQRGVGGVQTAISYNGIGLDDPLIIDGAVITGNIMIGATDARYFYLTNIYFSGGGGLVLSGPANQTGTLHQVNGQRDEWVAGVKVSGRATGGGAFQAYRGLTYGATVATDASLGNVFQVNVTDTNAFTMGTPTNPAVGQIASWRLLNNAGVMGAVTWGAGFKLAGAWVNPAVDKNRSITFQYDGGAWYELSRTAADVPN